jgi:hypothetical protein
VFFSAHKGIDGETLLERARKLDIDLERAAQDDDLARSVYSGRLYWEIFLKGYAQYLEGYALGPGNIYYDYIVDYYAPRGHDPGVAFALRDPVFALHRIASRFLDLDQFRHSPRRYVPTPVQLETGGGAADPLLVYEPRSDEPLVASRVDGWHRLFAARVFGATKVPGEVVGRAGT